MSFAQLSLVLLLLVPSVGYGESSSDFINKVYNQINVQIESGTSSNALGIFRKNYTDPAAYYKGKDRNFSDPVVLVNFQISLMAGIWRYDWKSLSETDKVEFLSIALEQTHSFPLYRVAIINKLQEIDSLKAIAAIYKASQQRLQALEIDEGEKVLLYDSYFSQYENERARSDEALSKRKKYAKLFNPGSELLVDYVTAWNRKNYKLNPNGLIMDAAMAQNQVSDSRNYDIPKFVFDIIESSPVSILEQVSEGHRIKYMNFISSINSNRSCNEVLESKVLSQEAISAF